MNLRVIAVSAVGLAVAAIALLAVVTWTPPAHPLRGSGTTAVQAHFATGWVPVSGLVPAPTTSLDEVRCDARHVRPAQQPCPDAATLAQQMWPSLTQTPKTLYVPLSSDSLLPGSSVGINVEYVAADRTLTIHTYTSQPLYVPRTRDDTPGAHLAPGILLLVVETDRLPTGQITVSADVWIERLTGDEKTSDWRLGNVAI